MTARELIRGEQRIHGPGAEAFQVKRNELEPQRFEDTRKFGSHLRSERATQFLVRNFDTSNVSVMADTKLAETEITQRIFAFFDHAKDFPSDRASILHA